MSWNGTYPIVEESYILTVKITAGITCILSILGSALIIFTYIAFRDLRTTARQLLVNLSIADILIAGSHFVGLYANFERFLPQYNNETWNTSTIDPVCISQAAFSMFGTISSFLWSLAIGLYLVALTIWKRPNFARRLTPVLYIVCWGIPAIIIIPNAAKRYFGFAPAADIGWCYITLAYMDNNEVPGYLIAEIVGYEIWVYIVFLTLPILYIILFVYIRCKTRKKEYQVLPSNPTQGSDIKLLFVPVLFLILRIWTTIVDILVFYNINYKETIMNVMSVEIAVFAVLAGIGDNAQGFVNAILFCFCTPQVRKRLLSKKTYMCGSKRYMDGSALDENTSFRNDRQFYDDTTLSYGSNVQTQSHGSLMIDTT